MSKEKAWPVALKVDIESEGLKRVVEEGRLIEFVGAFSTLAAEHIKAQLVEQLAEAAVGLVEPARGISIAIGFSVDDPYGTPPKPWPWPDPWPWRRFGSVAVDTVPLPERPVLEEMLRRIVREEIERIR